MGECKTVPAGYFRCQTCFDEIFYACPAGTYSAIPGATACTSCPDMTYSNLGATACVPLCEAGTYLSGGICVPSPAGNPNRMYVSAFSTSCGLIV